MSGIVFQKWKALEEHIIKTTGCKPFSGAGINPSVNKKTTILRSVDDTDYYDDDLSDLNCIKYTLFGHNGDQTENEPKFNYPFLNKTEHIYVYRKKSKEYIWYGKYKIVDKNIKPHIGKDKKIRNIIVLTLNKIEC